MSILGQLAMEAERASRKARSANSSLAVAVAAGLALAMVPSQSAEAASGCGANNRPAFGVIMAGAVGCPSGAPPAIGSATVDVSTAEVLESVRERRRRRQDGQTDIVVAPPAQPIARPDLERPSAAKDVTIAPGLMFGLWVNGYLGYEQHKNLSPTSDINPTRKTTAGGGVAGIDLTYFRNDDRSQGIQWGVFAGYHEAENRFSNIDASVDLRPTQRINGPTAGTYLSYFDRGFSIDLAFKVDFFDFDGGYTALLENDSVSATNPKVNSVSETTYTLAANVAQRIPFGTQSWIEPTAGLIYARTEYERLAAAFSLADGSVWRVQGGVRLGRYDYFDNARLTTTVTGLLYSDVDISGLVLQDDTLPPGFSMVDEGKLRALGVLKTELSYSNGVSGFAEIGVYGGEDVWGVGGKLGTRYQW